MNTLTIDVCSLADAAEEVLQAWNDGLVRSGTRHSFVTLELLQQVLTSDRWQLIDALCGAGPMSVRKVARRVARDVRKVRGDVDALIAAGLMRRAAGGGVEFPYDAIKVASSLRIRNTLDAIIAPFPPLPIAAHAPIRSAPE
ncbi:transcriptional regulator [Rugamonas sp.]|uniref:HVO_A0114 family putative DNA-binding protein n=1 Tax=Rugamonas sp. TaxID=1926287 RepID=UPI0025F7A573|nr:transcriptional regulator [Rugamonas sp.]